MPELEQRTDDISRLAKLTVTGWRMLHEANVDTSRQIDMLVGHCELVFSLNQPSAINSAGLLSEAMVCDTKGVFGETRQKLALFYQFVRLNGPYNFDYEAVALFETIMWQRRHEGSKAILRSLRNKDGKELERLVEIKKSLADDYAVLYATILDLDINDCSGIGKYLGAAYGELSFIEALSNMRSKRARIDMRGEHWEQVKLELVEFYRELIVIKSNIVSRDLGRALQVSESQRGRLQPLSQRDIVQSDGAKIVETSAGSTMKERSEKIASRLVGSWQALSAGEIRKVTGEIREERGDESIAVGEQREAPGEVSLLEILLSDYFYEFYSLSKIDNQIKDKGTRTAIDAANFMYEAMVAFKKEDYRRAYSELISLYGIISRIVGGEINNEVAASLEYNLWSKLDSDQIAVDATSLYSMVFNLPFKSLEKAGRSMAQAYSERHLAEAQGCDDENRREHWRKAKEHVMNFDLELRSALRKKESAPIF